MNKHPQVFTFFQDELAKLLTHVDVANVAVVGNMSVLYHMEHAGLFVEPH
jgi:hypothetical protein